MKVCWILALVVGLTAAARHQRRNHESLIFRRRRSVPTFSGEGLSWKDHFESYMGELTQTNAPEGFNPKCQPYVQEPKGKSRGLVLLMHGFSACPGFWYKLTPPLLESGFTVIAPLFPGHGRSPHIEANGTDSYVLTDWLDEMPESGEEYEFFADQLMKIARKYKDANPGREMVLTGVSHGGATASYMAMHDPQVWNRILLMNPFLAVPTALGEDYGLSALKHIIPDVLPAFQLLGMDELGWGGDCELKRWPGDPRQGGHGQICQFSLTNFKAVLDFGNEVEGEARYRAANLGVFTGGLIDRSLGLTKWITNSMWNFVSGGGSPGSLDLKVQVLATAKDGCVSNGRVHFAAAALGYSEASTSFCVYPAEFEHTYINPIDKAVTADLWWLDSDRVVGGETVLDRLVDFIAEGVMVPQSGEVVIEQEDAFLVGDPKCAIQQKR